MIRVAFDYQIFASQAVGGISRYCYELSRYLPRCGDIHAEIRAPLHINTYLAEAGGRVAGVYLRAYDENSRAARLQKAAVFSLDALASFLTAPSVDILHETFYYSYLSRLPRGAARVITVHDMIHEKYPGSFSPDDQTSRRKGEAVRRADFVICDSHHTRNDLIERLDVPEQKIATVYLGVTPPAITDLATDELPVPFPYLLYVGKRDGYKNFSALVGAVATDERLRKNFGIVCFGGGRFTAKELSEIERLGVDRQRLLFVSGNDQRLATYYRNAVALVYPSLYEGFGIPPLEAMSCDCPVACSNIASLPEVVGPAAETFDPASIESIQYAIDQIVSSSVRRQQLIHLGRERVKQFSWMRCAEETAKIYRLLR